MKRATHRGISFFAAAIFLAAAAVTAPALAPVANGQEQPPAVPRSRFEPPSSQEPQKAAGLCRPA